ncbi:hypothetical protein RA086_01585 [Lactiplantibacillus sp. WILCCON 0030]|uniref:Integral membrane protein n=1 Tax=Lactiplantibacillus brownii TaxID=3069269 RepID=A0ABU1A5V6_9LACO|nr:hypothetical protein [Lactiplantibacillus brownii]MDQ7936344.1 hypothetical protein [Lactiplantibacillus brownii]
MTSRIAKIISWLLIGALAITELVATGLMWRGHSPFGVVIHGLLGLAMIVIGWWALRCIHHQRIFSRRQPSLSQSYVLVITNLAMLEIIAIHDCDHMRQAMGWGYRFTLALLLVNIIVYLPNLISIVLASQGRLSGVLATLVSGPLIAVAFLKLHLLGAWLPVWGSWNQSFFALGVDLLSWWVLAITAIAGVLVGVVATYILGQLSVH